MSEISRSFENRRTKMLNFAGALSNEILHHINVDLKEKPIYTVISYVSVNYLFSGNSQSKINELIINMKEIIKKISKYRVNLKV